MFQTKFFGENQNAHFILNNFYFFLFENRAFYEIMWKNILEPGRPHVTEWHMRISCLIPKATHVHSEYNTHCLSTATMVTRTRLIVTLNVGCLSCSDRKIPLPFYI